MTRTRTTFTLIGAALALAMAGPADAQIGGLIRKAKAAVDGPAKKDDAKAPSDAAALAALSAPHVVPITDDVLQRFEKGLTLEVELRAEFTKFLAGMKTPEEHRACQGSMMTTPAAQKIMMQLGELPENPTDEQMKKAMAKQQADLLALSERTCGLDPSTWHDGKRAERLREIEGKASDVAAPPGYVTPTGSAPPTDAEPGIEPDGGEDAGATVTAAYRWPHTFQQPHPYLRAYSMLKERIPPFCIKLQASAGGMTIGTNAIVSVNGSGKVFYVYSDEEAKAMTQRCPTLMQLLTSLDGK